jgi:isopentenyl phosphate kinase
MLIIKAGGSAITDKSQPYTIRLEVIQNLAEQLREINEPIILAHGVGSYGHPPAKKYRIGHGFAGTAESRLGFLLTHYWVDELSQRFTKIMLDASVPVGRLRPTELFVTENRRIATFFAEPLERYLEMGIIPVLHGDGPTDRKQGFCILSSDQIAVYLARYFQARAVIFGMDVDGVLENGETVPFIAYRDLPEWQEKILKSTDASGGLPKKLGEIEALKDLNMPVKIINLLKPGTLLQAVKGEATGTHISN